MLSDDYLWKQSEKTMIGGSIHIIRFARAIEAEVRAQDEALIRQLVDALEYHVEQTRPISRTEEAIAAGRARLEGKP